MDSLINQDTSTIEESGLSLRNGHAEVKIIRSHFDTKMAKILSGAGGASCQLCTASFAQIHDISFVNTGYPINRTIHDARALFEEVDEDEFLSLPSIQRFNLTHRPISDRDIVSASPSGVLPKKEVGGRSLFKFSIFLENIGENGPQ